MNETCCRSCLTQNGEMLNLFEKSEESNQWCEYFQIVTDLNIVEGDDLPKTICIECSWKLKGAFDFRKLSKESDNTLRYQVKPIYAEDVVPVKRFSKIIKNETSDEEQEHENVATAAELYRMEVNKLTEGDDLEECLEAEEVEETIFKCKQCAEEFDNKKLLSKHVMKNHKNVCRICKVPYPSSSSLKKHFQQHGDNERPFSCDLCDKSYFSRDGLRNHRLSHQEFAKEKKRKSKYVCTICSKEFLTNQRLRIHGYVHTGEKNYPCDKCEKKFATEFRLRSHLRIHTGEKPYECEVCGQRFAQGNALKCHKRVHTGEKPYSCRICGKCFSQNTILKTHMTLHTGKTVSCPDCDKKFSRKSYLILHRREHTGEKPYICEKCPNRYFQKSHLDRHLDTHNGIKYRCEVCGKAYSKAWSLKIHSYTHTGEKPYLCPHCPTAFTRKDKYKTHIKRNHYYKCTEDLEVVPASPSPPELRFIENIPIVKHELETIQTISYVQEVNTTTLTITGDGVYTADGEPQQFIHIPVVIANPDHII